MLRKNNDEYNPIKGSKVEPENQKEKLEMNRLYETGRTYYKSREYIKAFQLFEKAFSYCSNSIEISYYAAQCQLMAGNFEYCLPFLVRLGEILDEREAHEEAWDNIQLERTWEYRKLLNIQWAELKFYFGNDSEAVEYCDRVLEKDPYDQDARRIKAQCEKD